MNTIKITRKAASAFTLTLSTPAGNIVARSTATENLNDPTWADRAIERLKVKAGMMPTAEVQVIC